MALWAVYLDDHDFNSKFAISLHTKKIAKTMRAGQFDDGNVRTYWDLNYTALPCWWLKDAQFSMQSFDIWQKMVKLVNNIKLYHRLAHVYASQPGSALTVTISLPCFICFSSCDTQGTHCCRISDMINTAVAQGEMPTNSHSVEQV